MQFNIYFDLRGAARTARRVPNIQNPITSDNLASLLTHLAQNLPNNPSFGIECVGVSIEPVLEATTLPHTLTDDSYSR